MCGIAGFYGFKDEALIKKISKQLAHRGPDGEGIYSDEFATLLNRRLAIIDRAGGDQPIFNEDGGLFIEFVGEIYNYLELRPHLLKKGHVFKTKSDTEVVLHGYEEEGVNFFDKLNGMFTIAIYDIKKRKLILARDHFGIKPLYYSLIGGNDKSQITNDKSILNLKFKNNVKFIYSSEIKPIFYSGLIEKAPNDRIIYRYLKYRVHDDGRETFFKNIFRLLPGEVLEIHDSQLEIKSYTSLKKELMALSQKPEAHLSADIGEREIDNFRKALIKAIKYRLISEVPVGTCLSGGLDSSTVVSVVNKLLKEKSASARSVGKIQKTFSAVFPGSVNDEERYIGGLISEMTDLKSFKVTPKPEEFFREMTDFVRTQEEPTISTGPYAQYKVMEKAHGKVTVLLDGQGADEMMAGYLPYYAVYFRQLWKNKDYVKLFSEVFLSFDIVKRILKDKLTKSVSPASLMANDYREKYSSERFPTINDDLKERLLEDIFANSLQSLLRYEDRNAMKYSIEGRVPFLDFNLLKYVFSLSNEAIIKNGWNKYILREATTDLLPTLINKRRNKIGFTTPEYEWFIRMKNKIYQLFASDTFGKRKYFNQVKILESFQKFIEGQNSDTMVFWRFMNIELWLREFFDPSVPIASTLKTKRPFSPNNGKKLAIKVGDKQYLRHPIKTELFKKGDNFVEKISSYSLQCFKTLKLRRSWFVVVSEKIVAISQGRSYYIWDIKPSFFASYLSGFVKKTPFGIGLGSPWTMQLAIQEIGLIRIIFASVIASLTKPLGIGGMFYRIAGDTVRSIDGPTEYSLYPSNVSAKLGPKEPMIVSENIKSQITNDKSISNNKDQISKFLGVVVIDANDIGVNVLGNSTGLDNELIEKIMKDNPMGQAGEQTPIIIVTEK